MPRFSASSLGTIMQLGYVVTDLEPAIDYWTGTMGIGPFFLLDHIPLFNCRYRGKPFELDISAAIAYWGDMQIELLIQHNAAPSIYKEWIAQKGTGLNHVCVRVPDYAAAMRQCIEAGLDIVMEGENPGMAQFFYADSAGGPGSLLEVAWISPTFTPLFDYMRDAAIAWDGKDRLRAAPNEADLAAAKG